MPVSFWYYDWWAMKHPRFWRGLRKELQQSAVDRPTEREALDNIAFQSWVAYRIRDSQWL